MRSQSKVQDTRVRPTPAQAESSPAEPQGARPRAGSAAGAGELLRLQRAIGNQAVSRMLRPGRQPGGPAAPIQRAMIDLSEGSRLPTRGVELGTTIGGLGEIGQETTLHVFAHSSGENLFAIETVGGMDPQAFAQWLAAAGCVYEQNVTNWIRPRLTSLYIHACASKGFAEQVKAQLVQINDTNSGIAVYGTEGISACSVDGDLVVIPMKHTNEWLKFEQKLGENRAREDEIEEWRGKYKVFPEGYTEY